MLAYPDVLFSVGEERCKCAVAQKAPCEGNRVLMGNESSLKPYQCGQDVGQEVPMRTPKRLYAEERIIYHPELLTCLGFPQ